jgi:hypothetical protein
MTWKPSSLTREQLEERRLEGGCLLKEGKLSQAEISRHLGVSRASVSDWVPLFLPITDSTLWTVSSGRLTLQRRFTLLRHVEYYYDVLRWVCLVGGA